MRLNSLLKEIRLSKKLTVKELSDLLSVDMDLVKVMESSSFSTLLSKKEINKILRKYSKCLNLKFSFLKKILKEENYSSFLGNDFINKIYYNVSLVGFLRAFIICAVIISLSIYIGIEIKNRYSAPELLVYNKTNYNTTNSEIIINGRTKENALLEINGENVLVNKDGSFSKEIILNEGLNIIKVTSAKEKGKKTTIIKRIIFENKENK